MPMKEALVVVDPDLQAQLPVAFDTFLRAHYQDNYTYISPDQKPDDPSLAQSARERKLNLHVFNLAATVSRVLADQEQVLYDTSTLPGASGTNWNAKIHEVFSAHGSKITGSVDIYSAHG